MAFAKLTGAACVVTIALGAAAQVDDLEERDRRYQSRQSEIAPGRSDEDRRAIAERLIRGAKYDSRSTEHYVLRTDDPRMNLDEAGEVLERFFVFFRTVWPGDALAPARKKPEVYLFWSFFKFNQVLAGAPRYAADRPAGRCWPSLGLIAVHTDGVPPGDLPDVIVREAARLEVERVLAAGGATPAPWLVEGLAEYFGHTLCTKGGGFQAGVVGGKGVHLIRGGATLRSRVPRDRIRRLGRALREKPGGLLASVVGDSDPADFRGAEGDARSAAAWMLVHMLLHGGDTARAESFRAYLASVTEGRTGTGILLDFLGTDPAALGAELSRHAKKVKLR